MSDSILKKLKGLMSVTVENGATEAEAAAFLMKARELMDKHGISQAEVLMNPEIGKDPIDDIETDAFTCKRKEFRMWEQTLTHIVNNICDTRCYISGNHMVFVGFPSDVQVAVALYDGLMKMINIGAKKYPAGRGDQQAYRLGCIDGLRKSSEAAKAASTSTALILHKTDAIIRWCDKNLQLRKVKAKPIIIKNREAYSDGYARGLETRLSKRQVS
jgi:hypothetical protein